MKNNEKEVFLITNMRCLSGGVVSPPDLGIQGPWFESHLRQNSPHGCMARHYTEPFIIFLPSSTHIEVVGCGKGVLFLTSPADIGLQLGKAYCPCSR